MWSHKKHGKKEFKSQHVHPSWDKRLFVLQWINPKDVQKSLTISFESWQMAKKMGWIKIK